MGRHQKVPENFYPKFFLYKREGGGQTRLSIFKYQISHYCSLDVGNSG